MPFSVGIQGQKKWRNPGHFLVVYSKPGVARHASKGRRNQRGGGPLILTDQVTLSQQGPIGGGADYVPSYFQTSRHPCEG